MRAAFFFDQSRCMGCNACTVACKDYYNVNPGRARYRKQTTTYMNDDMGFFYNLVQSCNHCKEPACLSACGAGAIKKRADGIVYVDRTKCQSLQTCIAACPFNEPSIADDRQEPDMSDKWITRHPMQKCNMCMELIDKGEQPVCVRACPMRAIEVGDYDELMRTHQGAEQLSFDKHPYAYVNNQTQTNPSLIIKPRKKLEVKGSI